MSDFVLPDLRYDYADLEPHISGRIMELHHDKHHRAYVEAANAAIDELSDLRDGADTSRIAALERALAFNASGHILHSIFWQNLSPEGGDTPGGELLKAINRDFGTFDRFREQMIATASGTMGSGWAALVLEPVTSRLVIAQIHDHQSNFVVGAAPLMVLDAWEHAYYLQYRSDKAKYFDAIWNVWNWEDIATRFVAANAVDLMLVHAASDTREVQPHAPGTLGGMEGPDVFDRI